MNESLLANHRTLTLGYYQGDTSIQQQVVTLGNVKGEPRVELERMLRALKRTELTYYGSTGKAETQGYFQPHCEVKLGGVDFFRTEPGKPFPKEFGDLLELVKQIKHVPKPGTPPFS